MPAEEPFQVSYSGKVLAEVKSLLAQAKKAGKLGRVVNALKEIDERLHTNPFGLGELTRVLQRMKLHLHVGFVRPLKVDFGIDENLRIVYVQKIQEVTILEMGS